MPLLPEGGTPAHLLFTAHSIPVAMARSGPYEGQLREACRLVAEAVGHPQWQLAFQSRSGSPSQPWLEPSVESVLRAIAAESSVRDIVIMPIGFLHDHMEVVFDLDVGVRELCEELGLTMVRAATPGLHPRFVQMIRELILERTSPGTERLALGRRPSARRPLAAGMPAGVLPMKSQFHPEALPEFLLLLRVERFKLLDVVIGGSQGGPEAGIEGGPLMPHLGLVAVDLGDVG